MKIHVYDTDPRRLIEPDVYKTNMGSFGIVADLFNRGLKEIGCYAEPDDAEWVGICDGLNFGFRYKDKKPFLIHVWDQINTIPLELRAYQKQTNMKMVGLSNQVSNLWAKYGVECKTAMPACDVEFYNTGLSEIIEWGKDPQKFNEKSKFKFLFESFANVRSGLDLAILAFEKAFGDRKDVELIIKTTSDNKILQNKIRSFQEKGCNICSIWGRADFQFMRNLYISSQINLHVYRHSSWGLGIHQGAACNAIPIVGDFCPSNEMKVGIRLFPKEQVPIKSLLLELCNEWGLHNAYGNFTYDEEPMFYDYNINNYAVLLQKIYENYGDFLKNVPLRKSVEENFNLRICAENLVKALE